MILYKNIWWWLQVYNEFKEYEGKKNKLKIGKVMKFTSKNISFAFEHYRDDKL